MYTAELCKLTNYLLENLTFVCSDRILLVGLTPEYEVLLPLHDTNIQVWALEIQGNVIQPGVALQNVVEKTGGEHLVISSSLDNVSAAISDYFSGLRKSLQSNLVSARNVKLIFKYLVPAEGGVVARMKGIQNFQAFVIPLAGDLAGAPVLLGPVNENGGDLQDVDFTGTELWNWDDPIISLRSGLYKELTLLSPVDVCRLK
jgi:hypothetical protein